AFRQSPNPRFAAAATRSLRESISPNERLQTAIAPFVAFVVLPVFALANAGVRLDGPTLAAAWHSPLTWAVVLGLVVGKLVSITGATALVQRLGWGRLAPGLTVGRVAGGAALSGIGFTISLLMVDIALPDEQAAAEARVGVLTASLLAFGLGALAFRLLDRYRPVTPVGHRLLRDVDPSRDHVRGRLDAPHVLVEYGDFECPFCSRATGSVDELRTELGDDLLWVFRHLPLTRVHPHAVLAARAAEAAHLQGRFFEYGPLLFARHDRLDREDLLAYAADLRLDVDRFEADLDSAEVARRVQDDLDDADLMDLSSTPTFFVDGVRHAGPWDAASLAAALRG
ncbi:MAG: Na+/H+ antiporter NhaA, partial [Actinobacteria bacterium]|nr:Na+/H+ antiporter NhaA [Actinomycetota bacterium]